MAAPKSGRDRETGKYKIRRDAVLFVFNITIIHALAEAENKQMVYSGVGNTFFL